MSILNTTRQDIAETPLSKMAVSKIPHNFMLWFRYFPQCIDVRYINSAGARRTDRK